MEDRGVGTRLRGGRLSWAWGEGGRMDERKEERVMGELAVVDVEDCLGIEIMEGFGCVL